MSDEVFIILFVATAPLAALIPAVIASNKGRSFLGFYVYGLFFWLIALIHSLVMESRETPNPDAENEESPPTKKPATRDLDSDAYKLYLAEKYSIKRNDAFEKFVCDDKLFDSIDIALAHANRLENLELQALQQQELEREIQARESAVEAQAANEGMQKAVNESLPFVAIIGAALIALIFWAVQQEKIEEIERANPKSRYGGP